MRARFSETLEAATSWKHILLVVTVSSVLLGALFGLLMRFLLVTPINATTVMLVGFPGEIFIRLLKMIILPLVISSLVSGLAQLDTKQSGKMGWMAICYYLTTTTMAVIVGIALVQVIKPGTSMEKTSACGDAPTKAPNTMDTSLDLIRNMLPENLVQATLQQVHTKYAQKKTCSPIEMSTSNVSDAGNLTIDVLKTFDNITAKETLVQEVRGLEYKDGMNVLGLIVFFICFGIVVGQMRDETKVLVDFFSSLEKVIMRIVLYIMKISPIGIFCLISSQIMQVEDLGKTFIGMGVFVLTVFAGLLIHSLITLPLIFFITTRENPFSFIKGLAQALITGFGISSSAATLPVTFRCLEEELGVDRRVTSFVLPIGATVNMDGAALYLATSAIFISQHIGMTLTLADVIVVSITATLASVGAAAVPGAAMITLMLVLTSVGLPTSQVSLIFTVDWLLDRVCTSVNILGDALATGMIHHFTKDDFAIIDAQNTTRAIPESNTVVVRQIVPRTGD